MWKEVTEHGSSKKHERKKSWKSQSLYKKELNVKDKSGGLNLFSFSFLFSFSYFYNLGLGLGLE